MTKKIQFTDREEKNFVRLKKAKKRSSREAKSSKQEENCKMETKIIFDRQHHEEELVEVTQTHTECQLEKELFRYLLLYRFQTITYIVFNFFLLVYIDTNICFTYYCVYFQKLHTIS